MTGLDELGWRINEGVRVGFDCVHNATLWRDFSASFGFQFDGEDPRVVQGYAKAYRKYQLNNLILRTWNQTL